MPPKPAPLDVPLPTSLFARKHRVPYASTALGALAATLVFSLGFGAKTMLTQLAPPAPGDLALATIATSHFSHVSLAATVAGAPPAEVLYARDGTWLYAIVDAPAGAYRLRVSDIAHRERIDPFAGDERTGTLFEPGLSQLPVSVDLLRAADGAVVATAQIAYPETSAHLAR